MGLEPRFLFPFGKRNPPPPKTTNKRIVTYKKTYPRNQTDASKDTRNRFVDGLFGGKCREDYRRKQIHVGLSQTKQDLVTGGRGDGRGGIDRSVAGALMPIEVG